MSLRSSQQRFSDIDEADEAQANRDTLLEDNSRADNIGGGVFSADRTSVVESRNDYLFSTLEPRNSEPAKNDDGTNSGTKQ